MADITVRNQGNVSNEEQVNWRGDQVSVVQGGQSIYETSSVKLAELGSRKVVGDRVFRYALATGACQAGDVVESQPANIVKVTAGSAYVRGMKKFNWYSATAVVKDYWADGYLIAQSGTATNMGFTYKVKAHAAIATTSKGDILLYDPLGKDVNVTDSYSLQQNPYAACIKCTTGAAHLVMGVAPISVTSADYFWLQTWGPAAVKAASGAIGGTVIADVTGQVIALNISSAFGMCYAIVGQSMQLQTASERGLVFVQIAP